MWEYPERNSFSGRTMSRQAQHWGSYCPSFDAWVKVKILAEIEKRGDLSYKGDKQWFSRVEGDKTDFHKKIKKA